MLDLRAVVVVVVVRSSTATTLPPRSYSCFIISDLLLYYSVLLWGFFWLYLVTQAVGNGWRMGWLVVLEGWCFGELPLPLFSLTSSVFFVGTVSLKDSLSSRAAVPARTTARSLPIPSTVL